MPRYQVIRIGEQLFVPMRYDNFASLGVTVEPGVPYQLVPLYRDVSEAVAEAMALRQALKDELTANGVLDLKRAMVPRGSEPDEEFERKIDYLSRLDYPFRFFRGEYSLRFNIMPTRYRFSGETDPLGVTEDRVKFEMACAAKMKEYLKSHGAPEAGDEQARAAARHFGAPSSFVDFSFNPEVAASFAHPLFNETEKRDGAPLGMLYSLGINDFERLFGMAAWAVQPGGGRDIHYLNLATVWRIPYQSFDPENVTVEEKTLEIKVPPALTVKPMSIRTTAVAAIGRIAAQEGLFIELDFENPTDWWSQVFLWTVLDFTCRKWAFVRQDFAYENAGSGITRARLFPEHDADLEEVVKGFDEWR
jgi:hypothetical protein